MIYYKVRINAPLIEEKNISETLVPRIYKLSTQQPGAAANKAWKAYRYNLSAWNKKQDKKAQIKNFGPLTKWVSITTEKITEEEYKKKDESDKLK